VSDSSNNATSLYASVKDSDAVEFVENDYCIKYYKKQDFKKYGDYSFDINSKNVVFPGCSVDKNYKGDLYITVPNFDKDHCIYGERDSDTFKDKKLIAFTFDDGPSKKNTNKLLDKLDCYQARVTFFVVGSRVYSNRDTIKRAYEMGNQIGSHTYSHSNLIKVSEDKVRNEIDKTNNAIRNVIGVDPTLLRPPYGSVNDKVNSLIDMNIILWNVDTLDWKYKDAFKVKEEILKYAEDGAIILLHDLYETSVDGALLAMDELITQGYAFVTIDEMAKLRGVKLNSSKIYRYIK
jgi:peptidoglycan/xylan/chitin deacetylase (PgdA/CDA1 family)